MKKIILGIIIGFFLSSSLIYAATYLYDAEEVSYTPSDTSWKVSTVDAALNDIKAKSGSALTNLKNTNIAKAVSANGSTLTDVITKLGTIANRGNLTKTINPGGSVTLSAGYYSGGKITANPNQNSGTYTPSSHGTKLDMGANNTYRYVNTTNAYNKGVSDADARTNTSSANYKAGYNAGFSAGKSGWSASLRSSSPVGNLWANVHNESKVVANIGDNPSGEFPNGRSSANTGNSGYGMSWLHTGQASVSKSGNVITVHIPQTFYASNRFGNVPAGVDRSITVQINVN